MSLLFLALPASGASFGADVALGRCAEAAARPDRPTAGDLGLAQCWLEAGDLEAAGAVLKGKVPTGLEAYYTLLRSEWAAQNGLWSDVKVATPELALPGRAGVQARLLRARSLGHQGDLSALRSELQGAGAPEARYRLATLLGPGAERTAALVDVWARAEGGGWDRLAEEELKTSGTLPSPTEEAGRAAIQRRVAALAKAGRHGEAHALRSSLGPATASGRSGWISVARAASKARAHGEAAAAWIQALGPPAAAIGSPTELFDYALAQARAGDFAAAAQGYQALITQHPTSSEADFGSFKLGYMHWDRGECPAAIAAFDQHLQRYPQGEHALEARWFAARCAWTSGAKAEAIRRFNELVAAAPSSNLAVGARYWLARAESDQAAARQAMETLTRQQGRTAYGWLAELQLHGALTPAPPPPPTPLPEGTWSSHPGAQLLEAGLSSWARDVLATARAATDEDRLPLASLRVAAGDARGARKLGEKYCSANDPRWRDICHPRPAAEVVLGVMAGSQLPAFLPYAIMTAESAMDPVALSPVGARGLMQLMPDLAERLLQERRPGSRFSADRLDDPTFNAELGTAELLALHQRFALAGAAALPATIAAYNAGPEPVTRWLEQWPQPDEFIENIPYTETRQYVKRVLTYLRTYEAAWR